MVKTRSYIRNKLKGGVKLNNFIALILLLVLIFLAFFYYKTAYMKENFAKKPSKKKITYPTPQKITYPTPQKITYPTPQKITYPTPQNQKDANDQANIFTQTDNNMDNTTYKDISFNTYWNNYFAPYHSINCNTYNGDSPNDYILNHLGYNNEAFDNGYIINKYNYITFLDNNPEIKKKNLKKQKNALTPDIYYNVFVPIFYDYSRVELLQLILSNERNEKLYVNNFCKLSLTPLSKTIYAN